MRMSESKKRKKSYYINASKKSCHYLDAGMKGFLLTCNNTEKRAVQEAYNVLNEYADLLYGPENGSTTEMPDAAGIDDFESAIRRELDEAREQRMTSTRRFQVVDTRTTNCVFVRTTLERPDELVSKFLADAHATKVSKTRFILRLFPVMGTCRATVDKIEKLAEEVLSSHVSGRGDLTYCIVYKVRCNSLSRDEILPLIGRVALRLNPVIKVNFEQPEVVVSVDVLQKFCCLSVMTNFHLYKKYNVQEICKAKGASGETTEASSETAAVVSEPDADFSKTLTKSMTGVCDSASKGFIGDVDVGNVFLRGEANAEIIEASVGMTANEISQEAPCENVVQVKGTSKEDDVVNFEVGIRDEGVVDDRQGCAVEELAAVDNAKGNTAD